MRLIRIMFVVLALSLVAGVLVTPALADQWNKKTVVTFNQPIEVPGKVLPAGTYVFKLVDVISYRHVVQIWNEDATELITTILAIPNYRLEPTEETMLEFHERPVSAPVALRAWFYPGDHFGHEFVYPKARAVQLAEASQEIVPAETTEPTVSELKTVPLVAVTPQKVEEPVTEAIQTLPLHPEEHTVLAAKELPATSSTVPLIALLGFASICLAIVLRTLAKQVF